MRFCFSPAIRDYTRVKLIRLVFSALVRNARLSALIRRAACMDNNEA